MWRRPWFHAVLFGTTLVTMTLFWLWYRTWSPAHDPAEPFFAAHAVGDALRFTLSAAAVLGAHEMGHYLACRRYGIPATLPYFIPGPAFGTFGAVIRIKGAIPHRRALFDVAAAGPIAGFVVALPLMIHGLISATPLTPEQIAAPPQVGQVVFGHSWLSAFLAERLTGAEALRIGPTFVAAWFGMLVTAMNLFPVGQLDGGHIAYAWSRSMHRVLSYATIVSLIAFVFGTTLLLGIPSVYTLWCVVLLVMRARHPRVVIESIPIDGRRKLVAVGLAILFAVTFMPFPLLIAG